MRASGFVGAVVDQLEDGDYLRVVTRTDLETLPPGVYSLDETRLFTGRVWDILNDRWLMFHKQPQELIARIRQTDELPRGIEGPGTGVYNRRLDGKAVVICWAAELGAPASSASDFINSPE